MHVTNTLTEYGIISKLLHWLSAILLLIQIPLGFYLVDLDFGDQRTHQVRLQGGDSSSDSFCFPNED